MNLLRPLALVVALMCAAPALADTTLSPSGLVQPLVGGSSNTWGATINSNYALLNSMFAAGPVLSLTYGGTGAATAAGARTSLGVPSLADANTWPGIQTFTLAPVFTDPAGSRTALGVPGLAGANTFAGTQTLSVAPVFTDGSGTRAALGLTIGTSGATVPLMSTANTWAARQTINAITAGDAGALTPAVAAVTAETSGLTYAAQYRNAVNSANYVMRTDHARTDGCPLLVTYQLSTTVGSICQNGTSTAFNTTSDYRLKTDVVPMASPLERLRLLRPVRFHWKAFPGRAKVDGFIAHEVSQAVPEAVTGAKDAINADGTIKPQQLDYSKLVPVLVGSVQELDAKVKTLQVALLMVGGVALVALFGVIGLLMGSNRTARPT